MRFALLYSFLCAFLFGIALSAPTERSLALSPVEDEGLEARWVPPAPPGRRCFFGYKARSRGRKVSLDGCSVPSPRFNVPRFTACCNNHDRCYGDCSKNKATCDSAWLRCMRNTCKGNLKCLGQAQGYYAAVRAVGNKSFRDMTKRYCTCHAPWS